MRRFTPMLAAMFTALLVACGSSSPSYVETDPLAVEAAQLYRFDPQSFAGTLEGGAYIGVINLHGQVLAYVCDGGVGVSRWFKGTFREGRLEATSPDGSTISAVLGSAGLQGSVGRATARESFSAVEVGQPAGLWLAVGGLDRVADGSAAEALHTVGWVVLPGGSQRGAANTPGGPRPAGVLDPATGQNGHGSLALNVESSRAERVRAAATYVDGRFISDECGNYLAFEQHARRSGSDSANRYWGLIGWATQCFGAYGSMSQFL